MNNTLPIIIKPSRLAWGMSALIPAGAVVYIAYAYGIGGREDGKWLIYAFLALLGYPALHSAWNFIVAPPRMIIDERGIGGRFVGGGFVGADRIAWQDITMAHYVEKYSVMTRSTYFFVLLDVDNTGNKYIARKFAHWWSFMAWWDKFLMMGEHSAAFAFNVSNAKLNDAQAREVVAFINKLAKAKPQESGASPFAAGAADNTLPIVVMPSRRKWGFRILVAAALFSVYVYLLLLDGLFDAMPSEWGQYVIHAIGIITGCFVPYGIWECIAARPRMIIDEGGVSGRFAARGLSGVKIAWDDIVEARLRQTEAGGGRILYLDVNNEGGKYLPVRFRAGKSPFAFNISNAKLNDKEAREVVALINKRAKGKPPEAKAPGKPQESGKNPFAAD